MRLVQSVTVPVSPEDRRGLLVWLQKRLIDEADSVTGKDLAPVAKALMDVSRELDSLPSGERSSVDDLAARRAARRAEAAG